MRVDVNSFTRTTRDYDETLCKKGKTTVFQMKYSASPQYHVDGLSMKIRCVILLNNDWESTPMVTGGGDAGIIPVTRESSKGLTALSYRGC
ncbi:MAG: hypothetical protein ACFFD2_04035 [Promethearchaeota archaeon]